MKMQIMTLAVLAAAMLSVRADVKFASVFGDRMVLQRDRAVRVWGLADPGESVKVSFGGQSAATKAGADGKWRIELAPMAASKEGRSLVATSAKPSPAGWLNGFGLFAGQTETGKAVCKDVLVGEVWFVCGQSNTALPLCGPNPHFRDAQGAMLAQMTVKPFVRFANTASRTLSAEPRDAFEHPVEWKTFTPENLGTAPSFSAMGVYFALELYSALDVPIAVCGSYWGGTRIEPWIPRCGFESVASCKAEAAFTPLSAAAAKADEKYKFHKNSNQQPMVLWNEQVAPWCPMALRGFIWYQGCANAWDSETYCGLMHALYNGWAKEFENPGLKLYFVQLAPWGFDGIAKIQEQQAKFDAEEPNAGMAVINDYGNLDDVHPNQKGVVGQRLAVHALKRDYGFSDLSDNSPTLKGWKVENGKFVLTFNDASGWYLYNPDWTVQTGFEIAGADGKFVPATVENITVKKVEPYHSNGIMEGAELIVSAPGVKEPKKLRYLYSRPWFGGLHNEAGLPLGAFHIGD